MINRQIGKYDYNAIDYKLITREDTSIIINTIMLIHKEFGGKSMVDQTEADIGGGVLY